MQFKFSLILLFIILLIVFGVSSEHEKKIRSKRTLQYFFEGLLSAFNDKHRSQTSSSLSPLTGLVKLSTFSAKPKVQFDSEESGESSSYETVQIPIPTTKSPRLTASSTENMPTKVRLPLIVESSTTTTTSTILTAPTASTTSTTSTAPTASTASTASTTTNEPSSDAPLETTTPEGTTEISFSTDITDIDATTIQSADLVSTLSPAPNEVDSNNTDAQGRSLPFYGESSVFRAASGRNTQFFGNPMILERHRDYHIPIYYDELVVGAVNDVEPHQHHHQNFYRAPKYLPTAHNPPPVIVVPIESPDHHQVESNQEPTNSAEYHSHVKVQHGNYHYYTYHGTGDIPAPVLSLRRVHMTHFGRRNDCDS